MRLTEDESMLMGTEPTRVIDTFEMTHPRVRDYLNSQESSVSGIEEWGVALYFLVNKSSDRIQAELKARGLGIKTTEELFAIVGSDGVKDILFDRIDADEDGFMTFPSKTVVLGHTDKEIKVPRRTQYRMHDKFIDRTTGEDVDLTTNLKAPTIQTKNKGVQTYEMVNTTDLPLRVNIRNLVCIVDVIQMDKRAENGNGTATYGTQDRGVIRLGNPYKVSILK